MRFPVAGAARGRTSPSSRQPIPAASSISGSVFREPLPYYFRRHLGLDFGSIVVCDVSPWQRPFLRDPEADPLYGSFLSNRPSTLDIMTENGIVCRCSHCDAWLQGEAAISADRVTVEAVLAPEPVALITSHHYAPISAIWIGVHLAAADRTRNLVARFLFGAGASRVDTSWPGMRQLLAAAGTAPDSIARMCQAMLGQDPMIAPLESRALALPVPSVERQYTITRVSIVRAIFESGESWSPPEAFDVDWHGLLSHLA
jgi:hypothetical protein